MLDELGISEKHKLFKWSASVLRNRNASLLWMIQVNAQQKCQSSVDDPGQQLVPSAGTA